jgi:hypothetical protein
MRLTVKTYSASPTAHRKDGGLKMSNYTNVFGGTTIYPSDVSDYAFTLDTQMLSSHGPWIPMPTPTLRLPLLK